ncbi:hypothetical protein C8R43DRAFT_1162518 [Mycena crocata]|nr:hypothetical protein C8R43DRAFT_1162518 [Mycena crocata]
MSTVALRYATARYAYLRETIRGKITDIPNSSRHRRERGAAPGVPQRIVSTLDPNLITAHDFLDLSQQPAVSLRFPNFLGNASQVWYYDDSPGLQEIPSHIETHAFPADCKGFMYYNSDPEGPPLWGSVRFRVGSGRNPVAFPAGEDLLLPSGAQWQIGLSQVACLTNYTAIREQLLHEGLTTEEQLSHCQNLFGFRPGQPIFMNCLDSVFPLDFSLGPNLTVVGPSLILHPVELQEIFMDKIHNSFPLTGTGFARFEPSSRPEHSQRRVLHLRITKITRPAAFALNDYTGPLVLPQEGDLLTVRNVSGEVEPWMYDITEEESRNAVGLRTLWNISQ